MSDFVYIKCPNCAVKIKIDRLKKYHDCSDCRYEFRIEDVESQINEADQASDNTEKESIFAKFMKEKGL